MEDIFKGLLIHDSAYAYEILSERLTCKMDDASFIKSAIDQYKDIIVHFRNDPEVADLCNDIRNVINNPTIPNIKVMDSIIFKLL